MPLFRELMGTFASDGEHLLAVCDEHGRLLCVEGHPRTRRQAEWMNFVPGARWAETAVGTNAPGTAVAVDRPVQVFAAEHFIRRVQPWTCAAAPVHDPRTGRVLGAVDITGGDGLAHPHSLGFVQAVARAAESQLALLLPERPASDTSELSALGRDEALLAGAGRRVRLSRRHSEILVLLSRHPEGLTGDELLCALHEDESVTPVTLRAELARLHRVLGPGLLSSQPYRLTVRVESDVAVVERRLESGAVTAACGYTGPLLPASQAPAVVRLRRLIADGLRPALVTGRDPDLLADWAHAPWGEDDVDVWRALAAVRPTASVRARLAALESELPLTTRALRCRRRPRSVLRPEEGMGGEVGAGPRRWTAAVDRPRRPQLLPERRHFAGR
ncbi:hypothetical protein QFZ32_008006 [Streptomyces canus]|nr:hypothetical protein [Streptomyces canus]